MHDLRYLPISHLDPAMLFPLMAEEEKVWMSDLNWDYSPIRQILSSFIKQKLLPGYAAVLDDRSAVGYTYFLVNQAKGIIGALYVSKSPRSQEWVENLLSLSIAGLKEAPDIRRVEAQILPFNNVNLTATFTQNGFSCYPRYFMELEMNSQSAWIGGFGPEKILPWDPAHLERSGEMTVLAYHNQTDAEICSDYCSRSGCSGYLRSLVENPGCGIFMPQASFIGVDAQEAPIGYIICCRISDQSAMIPQIAIHPSYQGKGLGNALMMRSLEHLGAQGFRTVGLTVTKKNRRAFDWYQRLGFRIRKEFGAYVWQR